MEPYIPDLEVWLESRKKGIGQLKVLVEELNCLQRGADVTSVLGSLTSIGGVLVGLGAIALTPATGGAALVPGILAVNAGMVGKGVGVVGNIVKQSKTKHKLKEVQKIYEDDKICTEKILKLVEVIQEVEQNVLNVIESQVKENIASEDKSEEMSSSSSNTTTCDSDLLVIATQSDHKKSDSIQAPDTGLPNIIGKVKTGIAMARRLNLMNINKMLRLVKAVGPPITGNIPKLAGGTGASANTAVTASANILQLGNLARFGGVAVSVALLPIDVYNLITKSLHLKKGDMHKESEMIQDQIKCLEDEMEKMKEYLAQKIKELNNFVILMDTILTSGCQEEIRLLITQILKRILPLQNVVKAFDIIDFQKQSPFRNNASILSAVLVNCANSNDSIYKRISTFVWSAWIMGSNTAVFLQNTSFVDDPILWTLFGVSVNCFNSDAGHGISILLPLNFQGDIDSTHEYRCDDNDWNGRCLIVNVSYNKNKFAFVSILAPDSKNSRDLFMIEMSAFVKRNAVGKIILGSNFRCKLQTMTVIIKSKVSRNVSLSFIKGLIPFKEVSEYLLHKPRQIDGPMLLTYQMAQKYSLLEPGDIDIRWNHCCGTQVSTENHLNQIKPILDLGLIDLLEKKMPGTLEFSTETEVSHRVVNCNQNLDFFVSPCLEDHIDDCYIDHTLRLLGMLKQSVLLLRGS